MTHRSPDLSTPVVAPPILLSVQQSAEAGRQWIHLFPLGTFRPRDGRKAFHLTDPQAVMAASRQYAGKRLIPIDYEHQTQHAVKNGQPAPAAGWIDALRTNESGIWGRVQWTERARAHLAAREYRYLSPTFIPRPDGGVAFIIGAALTNTPALDELAALASTQPRKETNMDELLAELRQLLALPDTATPADILAKVRALLTVTASTEPDPTAFVPIGDFERAVSEVNRLNKGVAVEAAVQHVELQIRNGNMPPALRAWGVALCSVNKVAFDSFIERTRGTFNAIVDPKTFARTPLDTRQPALTDDELVVCRRMGITEAELMSARSFSNTGA